MIKSLPLKKSIKILNSTGDVMTCDIRYPAGAASLPVVIICHSFMAFKEWGFFPFVAERIAEEGFVTLVFNFSRNGVAPDGDRITEFDIFASNSFSIELDDLASIVGAIRQDILSAEGGDPDRIVLLGHSRGGGIAISYTSRDQGVAALATWSAISTFNRWTPHQLSRWRERGHHELGPPGSDPVLRLGAPILADIETRLPEIDPVLRAAYIRIPWLIIHGRADLTVPVREAESLFAASRQDLTTVKYLDATGHLYNARSENEDHYMTINHVISLTVDWLREVTR